MPTVGMQPAGGSPAHGTPSIPSNRVPAANAATRKTNYQQPIFDSRIYSLVFPFENAEQSGKSFGTKGGAYNGGLTRGFMCWDKPAQGMTDQASLNFLYNPTSVTASYSMDSTDISSSLLYRAPLDTAQAVYAMNQSISFSLYFDRTFELWGAYDANGRPRAKQNVKTVGNVSTFSYDVMDPSVYGVNVDILAMKQLTGQMQTNYNAEGNAPAGVSQQGVMTMIPTWVYFGSDNGLVYHGYVSGWSVTVTHFTQYMIPLRCVMDVNFALLMPPANEPNGPSLIRWSQFQQLIAGTSGSNPTSGVSGR